MFLLCLGPSVHLPVSCLFLRSSVLNPWDEHWSLMLMASSTRVAWIKGDQGQPQDARMGTASASVCRRAVRLILSSRDIPRIQHSSWKLGDSLVNVGWEVTSKEFLVLSAPDYCYWALPVCVRAVVRGVDLCGSHAVWDSPLLGIYLEETMIQKDTWTPVFIAALFTIARTWKQPKVQQMSEQRRCSTHIQWNITQLLKWMHLNQF